MCFDFPETFPIPGQESVDIYRTCITLLLDVRQCDAAWLVQKFAQKMPVKPGIRALKLFTVCLIRRPLHFWQRMINDTGAYIGQTARYCLLKHEVEIQPREHSIWGRMGIVLRAVWQFTLCEAFGCLDRCEAG